MFDEIFQQCVAEFYKKQNRDKINLYLLDPAAQYIKDYLKPYLIVLALILFFILALLLRIFMLLPSVPPKDIIEF